MSEQRLWKPVPEAGANDEGDPAKSYGVWRFRPGDDQHMGFYGDLAEAQEAADYLNALEQERDDLKRQLESIACHCEFAPASHSNPHEAGGHHSPECPLYFGPYWADLRRQLAEAREGMPRHLRQAGEWAAKAGLEAARADHAESERDRLREQVERLRAALLDLRASMGVGQVGSVWFAHIGGGFANRELAAKNADRYFAALEAVEGEKE